MTLPYQRPLQDQKSTRGHQATPQKQTRENGWFKYTSTVFEEINTYEEEYQKKYTKLKDCTSRATSMI